MASKIEPRILDAAIALFADYGYFGVTTRDLARKAKVTEGSIYRLFGSKDKLFERSLETVIGHMLDPAQFLLMIFENRQKQDFPSAVSAPVRRWYSSLTHQSARLLIQATLCKNEKWRHAAQAPLEKIIDILAGSMERETTKANMRKFNAHTVARALILALFQFKITAPSARSAKEEGDQVEGILQHWIQGLAAVL
ncbi:MAG TPA: helix-turn-helix domain-containing protein [Candidatus Angelobacter sp.]|jgi:AcrR family transcriptional regulator|nr:helix-turn-helix domain-containing protein [Candidatus Angelobacter sp.]